MTSFLKGVREYLTPVLAQSAFIDRCVSPPLSRAENGAERRRLSALCALLGLGTCWGLIGCCGLEGVI